MVEIMFKVPTDFPTSGILNVPGLSMKQGEQTRGVPLKGFEVKVTNGFYVIGYQWHRRDDCQSSPKRSRSFIETVADFGASAYWWASRRTRGRVPAFVRPVEGCRFPQGYPV